MSKGAHYEVDVTEYYSHNGERLYYTVRSFFHGKDVAIKRAKEYAKNYGCGEFVDIGGSEWFHLMSESCKNPSVSDKCEYQVSVYKIKIED